MEPMRKVRGVTCCPPGPAAVAVPAELGRPAGTKGKGDVRILGVELGQ